MAENKEKCVQSTSADNGDKELDDLLDSALEDLTKEPSSKENTVANKSNGENPEPSLEQVSTDQLKLFDEQWTDEIKNLAANYESTMEALMSQLSQGDTQPINTEDLNANMQKLAEAASQVFLKGGEDGNEVTATIAETLRNLSQGAETARQTDISDEQIATMLSSMGLTEGAGEENAGFMLQGMMQALLSKELLYPSLKLITDKYPDWLEENRSKLDTEQLERYTKQCHLMKTVCTELESETDTDSSDMKKERTNKVLGLMQQLEFLGQPPSDLVGTPTENVFDPQGACSVM